MKHTALLFLLSGTAWLSAAAKSLPQGQRIPDEIESVGGHSLGFGNAGSAAASGLGSVRTNPAMLGVEPNYSLSAGYHWPSVGREFYQAGAVDAKTSKVAAGVSYTSSREKIEAFDYTREESAPLSPRERFAATYDSPISYRVAGGVAQTMGKVGLGFGGQYVEGYQNREGLYGREQELVKGATFGLGLAGLLTPALRFGISAENFANSKVADLAPRTMRIGLAYTLVGGQITLHLDGLQRERVWQEKRLVDPSEELALVDDDVELGPERLVTGSFSIALRDAFRILGAYGQDFGGTDRKILSGGVALVSPTLSLSYLLSQPYMSDSSSHQAINLSFQLAI